MASSRHHLVYAGKLVLQTRSRSPWHFSHVSSIQNVLIRPFYEKTHVPPQKNKRRDQPALLLPRRYSSLCNAKSLYQFADKHDHQEQYYKHQQIIYFSSSPPTKNKKNNKNTPTSQPLEIILYKRNPKRNYGPRALLGFTHLHLAYWTWYVVDFQPAVIEKGFEQVDQTVGMVGLALAAFMWMGSIVYPQYLIGEMRHQPSTQQTKICTYSIPLITLQPLGTTYPRGVLSIDNPRDRQAILKQGQGSLSNYQGHLGVRIARAYDEAAIQEGQKSSFSAMFSWLPRLNLLLDPKEEEVQHEALLAALLLESKSSGGGGGVSAETIQRIMGGGGGSNRKDKVVSAFASEEEKEEARKMALERSRGRRRQKGMGSGGKRTR